ncbi:hypothetical protein [Vampirovibrio sp.]|uniref:hypothetical protein n=1 Tax=Vampirovibrio sp. TaxID=2717857 RepID=UPI003594368B
MKSGKNYLKIICKTVLPLGLSASLCFPAAYAFPFFKKKPPAQELPPKVKISPEMMNIEGQPPSLQPLPTQPKRGGGTPAFGIQPADPVQEVSQKKIFSQALLAQTQPVTRAQLAEVMVKAMAYDTTLLSQFPFYRDVPLENPAYMPIEVAREKKLMEYQQDHGFYYPDKPITYGELYLVISRAITGPPLEAPRAAHLLRNIPERAMLTPELYNAVAKMAQSRFFEKTWRHQTRFEPVAETVTPQGLAPFVAYMMFLKERRTPVTASDQVNPQLPAGLKLVISPSTGILEERLKAGGRIRFQLINAVETIPRGSMVRGTVQEASTGRTYQIIFNSIQATDGKTYDTRAELSVSFTARDKLGFIVPGETFEVITLPAEPAIVPVESLQSEPPPLTPPNPNLPDSKILRQPAKTIPQ